jgi:arsenate reductase
MTTVLFACAHDAGRSQMAAAWFNLLADPARARAISAGTEPRTQVHPEVVTVTREVGVDLTAAPTTKLSDEVARQAQWVVTMACGDQCPAVPGVAREEWACENPQGTQSSRFA